MAEERKTQYIMDVPAIKALVRSVRILQVSVIVISLAVIVLALR